MNELLWKCNWIWKNLSCDLTEKRSVLIINTLTPVCIFSIPFATVYICHSADKENLFNNQGFFYLVIISFIFMTLKCLIQGGYCKKELDASRS